MALFPLTAPYALKNARLEIAPYVADVATAVFDDYTAAVSDVTLTPTTPTATWTGIGGNTISDVGSATWAAAMGYAQDLDPDGLQRYLHDHHGETRILRFTPITAAGEPGEGVAVIATVRLAAGAIGGAAGPNTTTSTSTMGVIGTPSFDDPTP